VAGSPRWSADAKKLYYYETTELGAWYAEFGNETKGTTQIVSIDIADGSMIQHTTGDGIRVAPQSLPHEALDYLAKLKDGNVIRVVQKDGATVQSQAGNIQGPSWSTDGKQVVYYKFHEFSFC
jgi:Tol biopolymer transport system component